MNRCSLRSSFLASAAHWGRSRFAIPKLMGRRCNASTKADVPSCPGSVLNAPSLISSRSCRNQQAMRASTVTCVVKALVLATADSRPALQYTPTPVVRAISDPTALTTEMVGMPLFSACFTARCTSFVSPDCDTASTPPPVRGRSCSRISAASHANAVSNESYSRISFAPYWLALRLVPHPAKIRFLIPCMRSLLRSRPPK
mmetsp:Transcript_11919/g.20265  ORF Transcript_11919/g.20265 Transcript_11919/m.20265 type:complete len:201 (+) Transcript_11919:836-1438(+)